MAALCHHAVGSSQLITCQIQSTPLQCAPLGRCRCWPTASAAALQALAQTGGLPFTQPACFLTLWHSWGACYCCMLLSATLLVTHSSGHASCRCWARLVTSTPLHKLTPCLLGCCACPLPSLPLQVLAQLGGLHQQQALLRMNVEGEVARCSGEVCHQVGCLSGVRVQDIGCAAQTV